MPRFVVHEHHARKLHWDLRLEMKGVLRSWALPKGPPLTPGTRRLAVQVEDHMLEYLNFEGEIPPGQYGAGKVLIWDKGTYEIKELSSDKISIVFHGSKLNGRYTLVRARISGKDENWLLIKNR